MTETVNMEIKEIKGDLKPALRLAWDVFLKYEAPDYGKKGVKSFENTLKDKEFLEMHRFFGAYIDNRLVGVIATRNCGCHIALFFVEGDLHRQGIGRRLFDKVRGECRANEITVNSSPYACEVYHHLGFTDTDTQQETDGIKYTPMIYDLGRNK